MAIGFAVMNRLRLERLKPLAGMPPTVHRENLYSEAAAGRFSPVTAGVPPRVYVPDVKSGDVYVIDPASLRVIARFPAGRHPQHVVPSYDLRTLWVAGSAAPGRGPGFVMPIDPKTSKPGQIIIVPDAYNLYFTPDGRSAVIVAEEDRASGLPRSTHHAFPADCTYTGVPWYQSRRFLHERPIRPLQLRVRRQPDQIRCTRAARRGQLKLPAPSMPQDVRISPDGRLFYIADMMHDGVFLVDGERFRLAGFIHTGTRHARACRLARRQDTLCRQQGLARGRRSSTRTRQRLRH